MTEMKDAIEQCGCDADTLLGLLESLDEMEAGGSATPRTRSALIQAALERGRVLHDRLGRMELTTPRAAA